MRALRFVVVSTVAFGLLYSFFLVGIGQLLFPWMSRGSLIRSEDGQIIGSHLLGQEFTSPLYFWGRPRLPSSKPAFVSEDRHHWVHHRIEELLKAHPGTREEELPTDLIFASASGVDPEISPAAALFQVKRVLAARGLPQAKERQIVEMIENLKVSRQMGFMGAERINVLALNLELDRLFPVVVRTKKK